MANTRSTGSPIAHLRRNHDRLRPELDDLWSRHGNQESGTWAEVFGENWQGADEVFMAWPFASYAETLARGGKAVKPLPMYANAWLGPQPGQPCAGDYPSGGPTARVIDVWKAAAPSLDLLAPDIYVPDVKAVLADYAREDNPLLVPEAQFRTGSLFYAIGHHRAIGFSVFGNRGWARRQPVARAFALLAPMNDLITSAQAHGRIEGILLEDDQPEHSFTLGGYQVTMRGTRELLNGMLRDVGSRPRHHPRRNPVRSTPHRPTRTRGRTPLRSADCGRGRRVRARRPGPDCGLLPRGRCGRDRPCRRRTDGSRWLAAPGRVLNGDERLYLVPIDHLGVVRIRLLRTTA